MTDEKAKVALFWDESFLWGLIAYDTFREIGVEFDLLTSEEIREGALEGYRVLFVPGGWASDKIVALGDEGREQIRNFVDAGGSYFGICGGAGLALSHGSGLGLVPIGRKPSGMRLPSFSGAIELQPVDPNHPMWQEFPAGGRFHAWWPGQFSLEEVNNIAVLASYGAPTADAYVTDLPVLPAMDWRWWEEKYGINLDPRRIVGEPAVIETRFGNGKVLLSYLHFETPGDTAGHTVLLNILNYLAGGVTITRLLPLATPVSSRGRNAAADLAAEIERSADELIEFGERNFLWFWRNDWILQWRRGVRGVEYSTLHAMLKRLAEATGRLAVIDDELQRKMTRLRSISEPFFQDARQLLTLERNAISRGPVSPLKSDDEQIQALREKLFSSRKRCGGLYKELIALTDDILLPLLRAESHPTRP